MEHQRNRSSSDNSHSSQVQKGCVLAMSQNKKKIVQKLNMICSTYGKKHKERSYYRETRACFGYRKHEHMVQDCLKNKKSQTKKHKEGNKKDKHKPKVQREVFAITRHDAQANSDAMSSTIQIHTLFARMLIDSSLMYSFV